MTTTRILLILNILLGIVLAERWIDHSGQLRTQSWQPPQALVPDWTRPTSNQDPLDANPARYMAVLDQPLFAPDRLPPPPPEVKLPPPPPPPPDPLESLQIFGLYQDASIGGMIGKINGRTQRLAVGQKLGDWTLNAVESPDAVFTRDAEVRRIKLLPAHLRRPREQPNTNPNPNAPAPVASQVHDPELERQMREEATRENTRRQNEIRARAGLLPIRD